MAKALLGPPRKTRRRLTKFHQHVIMTKLELILQAKAILRKCGNYDTSIAGAIGEIYAEEKLGMAKAKKGEKGYDGILNGKKLQVKTKETLTKTMSRYYVEISNKNIGCADELVVIILRDTEEPYHLGPLPIESIEYRQSKIGRRYFLNKIQKVLDK